MDKKKGTIRGSFFLHCFSIELSDVFDRLLTEMELQEKKKQKNILGKTRMYRWYWVTTFRWYSKKEDYCILHAMTV
jgi:hypothetical protein